MCGAMSSDAAQVAQFSNATRWIGLAKSAVPALFLVVDGVMKLFKPAVVVDTTVQLDFPESAILPLGLVLLACTALYVVPRTSVLGAILLTGYPAAPSRRTCAFRTARSR